MPEYKSLEQVNPRDNAYDRFVKNHPTVSEIASYVPVVGTAMDIYDFAKNPNKRTGAYAAVSLGSDILGYRLLKNFMKGTKRLKGALAYQELKDKHDIRTGKLILDKGHNTPSGGLMTKIQTREFMTPMLKMYNAALNFGINHIQNLSKEKK